MIIGTAGHIDHGKTTLVRALTGVDTDRLKEEKARGISIELGYAYAPLANGDVLGIIDVPGHEKFVHTMAAGAVGIDHALLVVAADDGVMPQTREAIDHARAAKVPIVVAVNKIDKPGATPERVKQQLTLLCQNQPACMPVKQRDVQAFFKRADLSRYGRLAQMQGVACMGQAARIRHRVKYSELVPIHPATLDLFSTANISDPT